MQKLTSLTKLLQSSFFATLLTNPDSGRGFFSPKIFSQRTGVKSRASPQRRPARRPSDGGLLRSQFHQELSSSVKLRTKSTSQKINYTQSC